MSKNTYRDSRRIEALLALGVLAIACPHAPLRAAGTYQLAAQIPPRIQKGEPASLTLRVQQDGRPVSGLTPCLAPVPLFSSREDAIDPTPAVGADLGAGPPGEPSACAMAMAAVAVAPGVYEFIWEPDAAGRVDLLFTVGDSRLHLPANVGSPPPDPVVLVAFVLFAGIVCHTAARMRRGSPKAGPA